MPRLSDDQLDERARGLGATDVATAAGVNPYQTPLELYLTRIGELDPDAAIDDAARGRMERGHRLEKVALEWDRDETGDPFYLVRTTVWHPTIPIMFCHPDATRDRFGKLSHLIEVKTSSRRWKEVPRYVEAQVQAQMACTGASVVDVLVLTFDGAPERFVVERDDDIISALEQLAVAFWDRIQRRDPPPMDGSVGASRWLDATRWRDEPEIRANDVQRRLLAQLVSTRAHLAELEAEDARLTNLIKETMAGSARLNAPGIARVAWTSPTTVRSTRWKEVADQAKARFNTEEWSVLLQEFTSEREQRTFRLTPDERED